MFNNVSSWSMLFHLVWFIIKRNFYEELMEKLLRISGPDGKKERKGMKKHCALSLLKRKRKISGDLKFHFQRKSGFRFFPWVLILLGNVVSNPADILFFLSFQVTVERFNISMKCGSACLLFFLHSQQGVCFLVFLLQ